VDVPKVLSAIRCEGNGEFVVLVADPQLPDNNGPWRVRFQNAITEVQKGGEPSFELDILALTQAVLGEPSLAVLVRQEAVLVRDGGRMESALRFFAPFPGFCLDRF
jgi:hypothetical protein